MKIIAHTPLGKFESKDLPLDQSTYEKTEKFLEKVNSLEFFQFESEDGCVTLPPEIIKNSVFVLVK